MEGGKNSLLKDKQFLFGLFGGAAVVLAGLLIWLAFSMIAASGTDSALIGVPADSLVAVETAPVTNLAINTFEMKKDAEICSENGLPVIHLFSTATCPHCIWIKDTFDRVAREYAAAGKVKAYHFDVETGDDLLTDEVETSLTADANLNYAEFSPEGYIPTFVFGCKYFRIGNGYESESSLAKEEAEFRAVIEDLLINNK